MDPTLLFYSVLILLLTVFALTYSKVVEMDHIRNSKQHEVTIVTAFLGGFIAWRLASHYFTQNPQYLMQFVLAALLLFVLPVTLFSVSVATITSSNT